MKIKDVISALERFAPLPLQEDYDNAGLQVGLTEADVSGVLLCLDVTEDIVGEALQQGCNMIVAHHPLIFRKLRQVSDGDYVQRCVMEAIRHGITIVAMHTNLDSVEGGVNYMMARKLGLTDVKLISPREVCGKMGSNGVIGTLAKPLQPMQYIDKVKEVFGAQCVMTNYENEAQGSENEKAIKTVALCGGAGGFVLSEAERLGADAFLTGEMHYHDFFGHENILITVAGHYETESYTPLLLEEIISQSCPGVRTVTGQNTNPVRYY